MGILGIGIDVLSLARLQGLISRRGALAVARRICAPAEMERFRAIPVDQEDKVLKYLSAR